MVGAGMMPLPLPQTFAEGQRAVALWLMAAGGVFCGLGFAGVILLLWLGGWTVASEAQRIMAIALMGAGFPVGMIAVILALAVGGPVGRFKASATKDGASFEAEGRDSTKTEVQP
jgi:hypothetical protein